MLRFKTIEKKNKEINTMVPPICFGKCQPFAKEWIQLMCRKIRMDFRDGIMQTGGQEKDLYLLKLCQVSRITKNNHCI